MNLIEGIDAKQPRIKLPLSICDVTDGRDVIFFESEWQTIVIFGFFLFVIILTLDFFFLCSFRTFFTKIARILFIMDKPDPLVMMWQMMIVTSNPC